MTSEVILEEFTKKRSKFNVTYAKKYFLKKPFPELMFSNLRPFLQITADEQLAAFVQLCQKHVHFSKSKIRNGFYSNFHALLLLFGNKKNRRNWMHWLPWREKHWTKSFFSPKKMSFCNRSYHDKKRTGEEFRPALLRYFVEFFRNIWQIIFLF